MGRTTLYWPLIEKRAVRWNTRRTVRRIGSTMVTGAMFGLACAGCTMPRRSFQPQVDPATLDDMAFLHYLATVPVVTVEEGARGVLMLIDKNAGRMTFKEQTIVLQRRGAMNASWRLERDQVLDRGTMAYMLRTLCELPRGLGEAIAARTGWGDRRYALRACVDAGLIPYGLPHDPVTGGELLSALTAAERHLANRRNKTP